MIHVLRPMIGPALLLEVFCRGAKGFRDAGAPLEGCSFLHRSVMTVNSP